MTFRLVAVGLSTGLSACSETRALPVTIVEASISRASLCEGPKERPCTSTSTEAEDIVEFTACGQDFSVRDRDGAASVVTDRSLDDLEGLVAIEYAPGNELRRSQGELNTITHVLSGGSAAMIPAGFSTTSTIYSLDASGEPTLIAESAQRFGRMITYEYHANDQMVWEVHQLRPTETWDVSTSDPAAIHNGCCTCHFTGAPRGTIGILLFGILIASRQWRDRRHGTRLHSGASSWRTPAPKRSGRFGAQMDSIRHVP